MTKKNERCLQKRIVGRTVLQVHITKKLTVFSPGTLVQLAVATRKIKNPEAVSKLGTLLQNRLDYVCISRWVVNLDRFRDDDECGFILGAECIQSFDQIRISNFITVIPDRYNKTGPTIIIKKLLHTVVKQVRHARLTNHDSKTILAIIIDINRYFQFMCATEIAFKLC